MKRSGWSKATAKAVSGIWENNQRNGGMLNDTGNKCIGDH
jgi:hypothetical protein